MVGGGSQNDLLCQLTADACGLPVLAGPAEAAALGNALVQARTLGADLPDLRRHARPGPTYARATTARAAARARLGRPPRRGCPGSHDGVRRMKRQLPKRRDLAPLLRFKRPMWSPKRAPARGGADGRGPAPDRQAAYAEAGVRLHRRRGGRRGVAGPGPAGVRRRGVPAGDPAGRLEGGHLASGAGRAGRAAVRDRADRLHPDDARRGRDRRGDRRGRGRDPVRALHDGDDVDRGRRGGGAGRPALVPALHVEGPRPVDGAGRPGREGRLRHAAGDRRRAGGGRPAPRRAQRHDDPADPDPAHDRERDPAARLVVQLPDHRAARVREPGRVVRARSPSCWTRCSTRP